MKTFDKSSKLDNVLYDVRGPVVDEAARMEADGLSILKLNIGNPAPFGFNAPGDSPYGTARDTRIRRDCFPQEKRLCSTVS